PVLFGRLYDKRAGLVVEGIGMGLEPSPLGLCKSEGKGVEALMCSQPDIFAAPFLDFGPEIFSIFTAYSAIHAIASHNEIRIGIDFIICHLCLEDQLD